MKTVALSFVIIASVVAFPHPEVTVAERSFIVDIILSTLENVRQNIIDTGLDPLLHEDLNIELGQFGYYWDMSGNLAADHIASNGLSSFVVNKIDYGTFTSRLTFDLSIPELMFRAENAMFKGSVAGNDIEGYSSGEFAVFNGRVWGQARVRVGIISGITVTDLKVNFNLDKIKADIKFFKYNAEDYTEYANEVLNTVIPEFIRENQDIVSEMLTAIVQELIEKLL